MATASVSGVQRALAGLASLGTTGSSGANQLFSSSADRISQGIQGLSDIAREQDQIAYNEYQQGAERNTQQALVALKKAASDAVAAGKDPSQIDPSKFLAGYGNQVDLTQFNQGASEIPQQIGAEVKLNQYLTENAAKQDGENLLSTISKDVTTGGESGKSTNANEVYTARMMAIRNSDATEAAKQVAMANLSNSFKQEQLGTNVWEDADPMTIGDKTYRVQKNKGSGEIKVIGSGDTLGVGGSDSPSVFATDIQYKDKAGNLFQGSKGKDGRVYDRNGKPVPIGGENGFTEVPFTMTDFHMEVMKSPENYTPAQQGISAKFLNDASLQKTNRGQMSQPQFVDYVKQKNNKEADLKYLSDGLDIISLLDNQDASRFGQEIKSFANKYFEPLGVHLGDDELNDLFALSESRKLEIVRSVVRAFAPVSDTAMKLTIDALEGRTLAEQIQAVKATYDKGASEYNSHTKTGKDLGVNEQFQGTVYKPWQKSTWESKEEMERDTNTAIGSDISNVPYIIENHPTFGNVTEADIQQTMLDNNMTRDQVMIQLSGVR